MMSLDRVGGAVNGEEVGKLVDLLVSSDSEPLDYMTQYERGEWVREALDDLSEQMRSVVQLVYYEGMKYREAADVLSIPVGTVKSRLHAAIAKLSEFWSETRVPPR
jgi:RNA polymerase sigma-70 factor (ECF subfamily)